MPTFTDQVGPGKTGDGCILFSAGVVEFPEGCVIKGNLNVRGTATVANGDTTADVLFDAEYDEAPAIIQLTPLADPGDNYWITSLTTTGFTINVGTAVSGDTDFMWIAIV